MANSDYIELPIDDGKNDDVYKERMYPEDSNEYFLNSMVSKNTERTFYEAIFLVFEFIFFFVMRVE